jgi:hypothetical protein
MLKLPCFVNEADDMLMRQRYSLKPIQDLQRAPEVSFPWPRYKVALPSLSDDSVHWMSQCQETLDIDLKLQRLQGLDEELPTKRTPTS